MIPFFYVYVDINVSMYFESRNGSPGRPLSATFIFGYAWLATDHCNFNKLPRATVGLGAEDIVRSTCRSTNLV